MSDTLSVKNIKPLPGYVLVKPSESQKQTASGIYLPDSHEEKPQHGTVLAVGEAAMIDGVEVKCPVKKDDKVIYKKWGGNEIKVDGKEWTIVEQKDILAIVE